MKSPNWRYFCSFDLGMIFSSLTYSWYRVYFISLVHNSNLVAWMNLMDFPPFWLIDGGYVGTWHPEIAKQYAVNLKKVWDFLVSWEVCMFWLLEFSTKSNSIIVSTLSWKNHAVNFCRQSGKLKPAWCGFCTWWIILEFFIEVAK